MMLQLDFFEKDEVVLLRMEVEANKRSTDRVRKGTYARINALEKEVADLKERLSILEANICASGKKPSVYEAEGKLKGFVAKTHAME